MFTSFDKKGGFPSYPPNSCQLSTKLCSSHPRLFNSRHILQVFDIEFESNHLDIQLSILSGLCDFFKLEEERSVKKHGSNKIRSDDGISSFQRLDNKREYLTDSVCSSLWRDI